MDIENISIQDFTANIKVDDLILTPNRRLANFIQEKYGHQQRSSVWEPANVYAIDHWVEKVWSEQLMHKAAKYIITDLQQTLIWEDIIINTKIGEQLLNIPATAEKVKKTWRMIQDWQICLTDIDKEQKNIDTKAFLQWVTLYINEIENNNWLDLHAAYQELINNLEQRNNCLKLPESIYFVCFQELSPQKNKLMQALKNNRVNVYNLQGLFNSKNNFNLPKIHLAVEVADEAEEIKLAAYWAKKTITAEKDARVAVIIPEIQSLKPQIEKEFSKVLLEDEYNISAPKAIITNEIIDIALLVCKISSAKKVFIEDFSRILRSNFIGDNSIEEKCSRVKLDIKLRSLHSSVITWELLEEYVLELSTNFTTAYKSWRNIIGNLPKLAEANKWQEFIMEMLLSLAWPNTNIDHDLMSCWHSLLSEYVKLTNMTEHTLAKALQIITKLATNTPFSMKTGTPRVQVLGLLEAVGIPFDYIWLTGMQRDSWPAEPKIDPFIPISLQKKYSLPKSSPQRELKVAKQMTQILLSSKSNHFIVSYIKDIEGETDNLSRLFSNMPTAKFVDGYFKGLNEKILIDLAKEYQAAALMNLKRGEIEEKLDEYGPKYTKESLVAGGSNVIKLQSHCPFRAFAEIRLQATPIRRLTIGLDPAERGILIHDILADFWTKAKSQENIEYIKNTQLMKIIRRRVESFKNRFPQKLAAEYWELEIDRTFELITKLLEQEKARDPFTVCQIEQGRIIKIGELQFKLRLDRVDQLSTGEKLIIDYKTSVAKAVDWLGDRPLEPQLPMYCLAIKLATDLAFIVVRADLLKTITYSGLSQSITWQQQLASWEEVLNQLSKEFMSGYAKVEPIKGAATCKICHLQSLCKYQEKCYE